MLNTATTMQTFSGTKNVELYQFEQAIRV